MSVLVGRGERESAEAGGWGSGVWEVEVARGMAKAEGGGMSSTGRSITRGGGDGVDGGLVGDSRGLRTGSWFIIMKVKVKFSVLAIVGADVVVWVVDDVVQTGVLLVVEVVVVVVGMCVVVLGRGRSGKENLKFGSVWRLGNEQIWRGLTRLGSMTGA